MNKENSPKVVFMFAGQGSQYVNMCRGLYRHTQFRRYLDQCLDILAAELDYDIKCILYPQQVAAGEESKLKEIDVAQIAVFIVEYAMARLLMEQGVIPDAMIGYSFGEYVAACVAGVFSLTDALRLVVLRGKLMKTAPEGLMLSVPLPEERARALLNHQLSLAIVNGASCVIAGAPEPVIVLEKQLMEEKYFPMRLKTLCAPHSHLMEPILDTYKQYLGEFCLQEPTIPYVTNVTGDWVAPGQAVEREFWVAHLRGTVQFSRGLETLLKLPDTVFIEIGPGRDLSVLLKQYIQTDPGKRIIDTIRHPGKNIDDETFLKNKISHMNRMGIGQAGHVEFTTPPVQIANNEIMVIEGFEL